MTPCAFPRVPPWQHLLARENEIFKVLASPGQWLQPYLPAIWTAKDTDEPWRQVAPSLQGSAISTGLLHSPASTGRWGRWGDSQTQQGEGVPILTELSCPV